ncbi:hypothetical protein V8E54_000185 [Elaphomyces granulatus]
MSSSLDPSSSAFSYIVRSDYLFDKSPEIIFSSTSQLAIDRLMNFESVRKGVKRVPSMSWMPHLRRSSRRQRDGHIWRLKGMQRLCEFIFHFSFYYPTCVWHFRVCGTEVDYYTSVIGRYSDHPCVALARNDMLYMRVWNQRYRKRNRVGCTPDGDLLRFAGDRCLYCSDRFDSYTSLFIQRERLKWDASKVSTDGVAAKAPWLYRPSSRLAVEAAEKRSEGCDSCLDYLLAKRCECHGSVECLC